MRAALGLLAVAAAGCGGAARPEVRVFGTLRDIMHEGKTGPVVALADVVPGPHLYALGALAGLRGEILVLDDAVTLSYPDGAGGVRVESADGRAESATLLVDAAVPRWKRIALPDAIPAERLDDEIAARAVAAGVDVTRRFPFVIEGRFSVVDWHVLDGSRLPATASHDERMNAAVRGTSAGAAGRVLGFYSDRDTATFTHMGTRTHLHVLLPAAGIMGHADHVAVAAGATLLVPADR